MPSIGECLLLDGSEAADIEWHQLWGELASLLHKGFMEAPKFGCTLLGVLVIRGSYSLGGYCCGSLFVENPQLAKSQNDGPFGYSTLNIRGRLM